MKNRLFHRLAAFVMAGAMVVSLAAVPAAATEVEPHEHTYGEDNICTICNQTRPELVTEDLDTTGTDDTKTAENTGTDVSTGNAESNGTDIDTDNGDSNEAGSGTGNGGNTGTGDGKGNTENSENTGTDNNGNSESAENTKDTENTEENEADKSEGTEGESLTEEEKAAQESAKRVAEVQALIDALPDQIRSDEVAQYQEKVAAIRATLATMTAEQIAQLTGLEKLELELTTADAVADPVAKVSKPDNIVVQPTIAQVGGVHYATVKEAVDAAVESGGEVVIGSDVALSKPLVIPAGKSVTLNLNGHTLSEESGCFGGEEQPDSLVIVDNGGSLTVTGNGTIHASLYGIKLTQASTMDENKTAKLVVESGIIQADTYFAITGNGSRHNTDITINGGTIKGKVGGIYHPQEGRITINGGNITGEEIGVEMWAGNLTINGGTITATANEFSIKSNPSGNTCVGAAVSVVPHTTNKVVSATINGGTLTAVHALHEENVQGSTGEITMAVSNGKFEGVVEAKDVRGFVTGGSFTVQPDEKLITEHFSFKPNGDNTFGPKEDPYIIDGEGKKEYIDPDNPDKPVSLDTLLAGAATQTKPKIDMGANGAVQNDHTMSGELTMQVNGHKITGTGSISGKLTLKDLNAKGTDVILPKGGTVTFQNGPVLVRAEAMTKDGNSVGYSKPIQITYGGHDYTYFLGMGGSNDGKLTIDANGKPTVTGQHYEVKAKVLTPGKFRIPTVYNGDVVNNDFYKNTNSTLQFVSDAPATALQTSYVTVDGKQITDSSCYSVTSGDTAAVTLSNKYLRSLSVGVHTLHMNFLDGSTAFAVFSVRTTSNADLSNPKTGDTIGLSVAVMVLSMTALAVLVPRKKRFF